MPEKYLTASEKQIEQAVAIRNPDLLVTAIEALIPFVPSLLESIFGANKYKRRLELINALIDSLPDDTPIHLIKDSIKIINEK